MDFALIEIPKAGSYLIRCSFLADIEVFLLLVKLSYLIGKSHTFIAQNDRNKSAFVISSNVSRHMQIVLYVVVVENIHFRGRLTPTTLVKSGTTPGRPIHLYYWLPVAAHAGSREKKIWLVL